MSIRLKLKPADKSRLKIMFLAKHALGDGSPDSEDGVHATYHYEVGQTLKALGLNIAFGNSYSDLFDPPEHDYLFTLLNRGGFKNSEMFAPLFATWRGIPHLGASPILRGLGDDKHLTKLSARARGITTPDSEIYRYGSRLNTKPGFAWDRLVVKPNASSASWGIKIFDNWLEARNHIDWIFSHDQHHDVIVENYIDGIELAVPVIGDAEGNPVFLPVMKYSGDDDRIRTYEEKRQLVASSETWGTFDDPVICGKLKDNVSQLLREFWPFDYGRFEFKMNPETQEFGFIEVNMSCNLWSKKTVANSWKSLGFSYPELLETILTHSLLRQGVITEYDKY